MLYLVWQFSSHCSPRFSRSVESPHWYYLPVVGVLWDWWFIFRSISFSLSLLPQNQIQSETAVETGELEVCTAFYLLVWGMRMDEALAHSTSKCHRSVSACHSCVSTARVHIGTTPLEEPQWLITPLYWALRGQTYIIFSFGEGRMLKVLVLSSNVISKRQGQVIIKWLGGGVQVEMYCPKWSPILHSC